VRYVEPLAASLEEVYLRLVQQEAPKTV
jgi:hypothetical protein